jgi:hypothetical protein
MKDTGRLIWLLTGLCLGVAGAGIYSLGQPRTVLAASDRYEDYVLCTGPMMSHLKSETDGIWLLDYRSGKLLGTVIDKGLGKFIGWAELDLVQEFQVPPRQNVHFMMETGRLGQGRSALYVTETSTGRIGAYTLASRPDGAGFMIQRSDLTTFRQPPPPRAN